MKDAKHAKGIRAGFDLELTCGMLSRALFVNSCSTEVDMIVRVPTHIIHELGLFLVKFSNLWGKDQIDEKSVATKSC